jgi:hypothetical protein
MGKRPSECLGEGKAPVVYGLIHAPELSPGSRLTVRAD